MRHYLPLLAFALTLSIGCTTADIDRIIDLIPDNPPEKTPEPPPPPPPQEEADSQRFLWKPVSASRSPRGAVLLPARIETDEIIVNATGPVKTGGRSNGHRLTFFLPYTGSHYGRNVRVTAAGETWTVPNGAERYEQ